MFHHNFTDCAMGKLVDKDTRKFIILCLFSISQNRWNGMKLTHMEIALSQGVQMIATYIYPLLMRAIMLKTATVQGSLACLAPQLYFMTKLLSLPIM